MTCSLTKLIEIHHKHQKKDIYVFLIFISEFDFVN